MTKITQQPFYAKFAFVLLSLVILFGVIWLGQGVLMPPMFALLFAILLDPIAGFMNRRMRIPRVVSILLSVLLAILVLAGIIFFISWQVSDMVSDWQKIKSNVNMHITHLQNYIWRTVDLNKTEQDQLLEQATSGDGSSLVGSTILSITDALMNFVLVPIYIFLFILYKNHFKKFLCKVFKPMHHGVLRDVLHQVRVSIRSYISGLMIQMLTVSVLTTTGYMIIGLDYAILLGVITGLLNLIPYVGILSAAVLSMAATLTGSADVDLILWITVVNIVVQFIDNNLLVPMIVSSKVEINAMVSITGIIIGGALGGVAGMFLAIPYIAITKVVFDRIPELTAWGYLMGDDLPKTFEWRKIKLPYYGNDTPAEMIRYTTTHTQPETNPDKDEN